MPNQVHREFLSCKAELLQSHSRIIRDPHSSANILKKKSAWVFAGQGSQFLGMGSDLWDLHYARTKLKLAEKILGWSVAEVCNHQEKLNLTLHCQPCLFVISSILIDLLKQHECQPDFVAGYSLGEYIALYAAEVFDFEDGLHLIKRRAEIMAEGPPGIMVALIGCDREILEDRLQHTPDVELISDDCTQFVLSGSRIGVESIIAQVAATRIFRLKVSGPFHTQLMKSPELAYQSVLNSVSFKSAQIPILSNTHPVPTVRASVIKEHLRQHMTQKICWQDTINRFIDEGVKQIIEIGPSKVLTKLIDRSGLEFAMKNITSLIDVSPADSNFSTNSTSI
jgi:[acyl-carrier-protein] S-malonyltransferase